MLFFCVFFLCFCFFIKCTGNVLKAKIFTFYDCIIKKGRKVTQEALDYKSIFNSTDDQMSSKQILK